MPRQRKAYWNDYNKNNRERIASLRQARKSAKPQIYKHKERAYTLKALYGMTVEAWDRMFYAQDQRCAICRIGEHGGRGWATDHNHETGKVRGILCHKCNLALGHADDSLDRLRLMVAYMEKNDG
jgi:Recombination endonuclease VII